MPTHQDETLQQRYAREHHDYLKLCGSMTAEQVADLQLRLNNALAREQALQLRLSAADQRVDELVELLQRVVDSGALVMEQEASFELESLEADICAALKPTESGASENT